MKNFAIITHVLHWKVGNIYYAYGPYVREMNIWCKHVAEITVVAPLGNVDRSEIHWAYSERIDHKVIPSISLLGFRQKFKALLNAPCIFLTIFRVMRNADHIHLRCPGNIGLIGCLVQICFPRKQKTAKYAGNWDPNSNQPWSYRFQKWILNNTVLTKNMQVLVYGEWEGASKNIKPFFTASYSEKVIQENHIDKSNTKPFRFLFIGSLVSGKQPKYAIILITELLQKGFDVQLDIYGDGVLRKALENQVNIEDLGDKVHFYGNQKAEIVREAYQQSRFLILPSKSEGWPKVVAESMFWGCIPIVSAISCVPWMLDNESRGVLLTMVKNQDSKRISELLINTASQDQMALLALNWSRQYTLEAFEKAIQALL